MLDVLICTHGARQWVERCLESLRRSERRKEFRVLIHDNAASERDGTREYLREMERKGSGFGVQGSGTATTDSIFNIQHSITNYQGNGNDVSNESPGFLGMPRIEVFYDERDLAHGQALDFLAERVEAPWFLAMDSDVEIVRRDWLDEVERVIEANPGLGVCAEAQATWVTRGAQYSMPRVDPAFALVSSEFFRREGLSFTVLVMKAAVMNPNCLPGALKGKKQITVSGDTGWQLFHAALRTAGSMEQGAGSGDQGAGSRRGVSPCPMLPAPCLFVPMPRALRACYVHHGSRSIQFQEMGGVMNTGDLVEVVYSLGPGATGTIRGRLASRGNPDIVLTETVEVVDGKEVQGLAAVIPRKREVLTRLIERKGSGFGVQGSGTEKRG